ncbi:MAG TPA: hypothetical protein VE177_07380 [Candidatus Binatus sp.]|nr:hypothetical protein [Candidatus Binatus sp.]
MPQMRAPLIPREKKEVCSMWLRSPDDYATLLVAKQEDQPDTNSLGTSIGRVPVSSNYLM